MLGLLNSRSPPSRGSRDSPKGHLGRTSVRSLDPSIYESIAWAIVARFSRDGLRGLARRQLVWSPQGKRGIRRRDDRHRFTIRENLTVLVFRLFVHFRFVLLGHENPFVFLLVVPLAKIRPGSAAGLQDPVDDQPVRGVFRHLLGRLVVHDG
jgi:hypothetical protein